MTKNEIKKALECCISYKDGMCKHCPNYDYKHEDCMDDVKRQALDLIDEQEKEIERLKAATDLRAQEANKEAYDAAQRQFIEQEKQAKIDVLNKLRRRAWQGYQIGMYIVSTETIDEMIEELKK